MGSEKAPAAAVAVAPEVGHDLVEGRVEEARELNLGHGSQPGQGEANPEAHQARLGERCVEDPVGPEAGLQAVRRPEDPTHDATSSPKTTTAGSASSASRSASFTALTIVIDRAPSRTAASATAHLPLEGRALLEEGGRHRGEDVLEDLGGPGLGGPVRLLEGLLEPRLERPASSSSRVSPQSPRPSRKRRMRTTGSRSSRQAVASSSLR
jgi:hypothetical protein